MSTYTKGQWNYSTDHNNHWILTQNGKAIALLYTEAGNIEANAQLIAASPSMIEFIQKLAGNGNQEAKDFIQTLDL